MNSLPEGGYGVVSRRVMRMPGVSKEAKAVYALLCSYTGDKDYCFPTVETLARDLETSERQVIRLTEELRIKGLVDKRKLDGNKRKTIYIPLVPESIKGDTGDTNQEKGDTSGISSAPNNDICDIRTGDTHGILILTGNTNTKENINTKDVLTSHPFDRKTQGIPQPIADQLERYREKVQDFGKIGRLMVPIDCAIAIVGPQIVHDAIAQVIAEAPNVEPKFRVTNIVKLLGDEQRLRERAAKYQSESIPTKIMQDYLSDAEGMIRLVEIKRRIGQQLTPQEIEACKQHQIAYA